MHARTHARLLLRWWRQVQKARGFVRKSPHVVASSSKRALLCALGTAHLPQLILPLDLSVELAAGEGRPGPAGAPGDPGGVGRGVDHGRAWGIHLDCAHRRDISQGCKAPRRNLLKEAHCGCAACSPSGSPPTCHHTPS